MLTYSSIRQADVSIDFLSMHHAHTVLSSGFHQRIDVILVEHPPTRKSFGDTFDRRPMPGDQSLSLLLQTFLEGMGAGLFGDSERDATILVE